MSRGIRIGGKNQNHDAALIQTVHDSLGIIESWGYVSWCYPASYILFLKSLARSFRDRAICVRKAYENLWWALAVSFRIHDY
jgi:hypothetical protein